jgi:hypothetical protein
MEANYDEEQSRNDWISERSEFIAESSGKPNDCAALNFTLILHVFTF